MYAIPNAVIINDLFKLKTRIVLSCRLISIVVTLDLFCILYAHVEFTVSKSVQSLQSCHIEVRDASDRTI